MNGYGFPDVWTRVAGRAHQQKSAVPTRARQLNLKRVNPVVSSSNLHATRTVGRTTTSPLDSLRLSTLCASGPAKPLHSLLAGVLALPFSVALEAMLQVLLPLVSVCCQIWPHHTAVRPTPAFPSLCSVRYRARLKARNPPSPYRTTGPEKDYIFGVVRSKGSGVDFNNEFNFLLSSKITKNRFLNKNLQIDVQAGGCQIRAVKQRRGRCKLLKDVEAVSFGPVRI